MFPLLVVPSPRRRIEERFRSKSAPPECGGSNQARTRCPYSAESADRQSRPTRSIVPRTRAAGVRAQTERCRRRRGAGYHPVHSHTNLFRRLAARAAIPEDQPAGRRSLGSALALVPRIRHSSTRPGPDRWRPRSPKPANSQVCRARCSGLQRTSSKGLVGEYRPHPLPQACSHYRSTERPSCRCAGH